MSEQAFEFEWQGKTLTISRKEHSIDIDSDREYIFGLSTIPGAAYNALLAERTHRADVFARLMEKARGGESRSQNYHAQLDALAAEWERSEA